MTFPMSVGATTVLNGERPTPDGVAALLRKYPVTVFFAVPTFYAAFLNSPNAPAKSEVKIRRCVSAGEALPEQIAQQMAGALRHRYLRRARHHRDAAHFSHQRAGRDQIRHHRTRGAGLRDQADRRGRQCRQARRDGRDFMCAGRPPRSCIGPTARNRARPSRANGRVRATNISRTRTAITSAAAAPTTC